MGKTGWARAGLVAALATAVAACQGDPGRPAESRLRIGFKHQPMWGDPAAFRALLDDFSRRNPDLEVVAETIPSASDLAHQYLLTALEGRDQSFDVFVADVIWVPELARAGWLADLSPAFPQAALARDFFTAPARAVVDDGRVWAVPWFVDVGILYYRTDLVAQPPATYEALSRAALAVRAAQPTMAGFVWQGRQYEGLSCNVFEAIWGHGGEVDRGGTVIVDTEVGRRALGWLRGLIESGVSPPSVTSYAEEETRRVFQAGRAVFMRNWPYAWHELQSAGSPVRGRVGIAALPTSDGRPGSGALGGWQLAVNAHVSPERRRGAQRLIAHLTSPAANLTMALHYSRLPPRRAVYEDAGLRAAAPFLVRLAPFVERARPRPITPYYNLLADTLQSELSGAVTGLRSPARALDRAQTQIDRLTAEAP